MSHSLQAFGLEHLTREERFYLAQDLWNSIAENPGVGSLPETLKEELLKRWQEHTESPNDVISWQQVEVEADARLNK